MANYQNRTTEPTQGKEQPEKKLWKAVLNQVFQDAFEYSGNKREEGEKKHALDYLKQCMKITTWYVSMLVLILITFIPSKEKNKPTPIKKIWTCLEL
jgi:hypothetical protein